jgi:TPR repeat protein
MAAGSNPTRGDGGDALLPAPDRKHPIGFAIGLYRRDPTFWGFFDFAFIGIVVMGFLSPFGFNLWPRAEPETPAAAGVRTAKESPDSGRVTTGAYDTGTPVWRRGAIILIDRTQFVRSPETLRDQLGRAADAFDAGRTSRVLDELHGADAADTNVLTQRGIATVMLGGFQNMSAGLGMLERARAQGHRQAAALMGMLHISGPPGFARDPERGTQLLEEAIARGDMVAARYLGMAYISGTAGIADPARGVRYLRMSADAGDAEAQFKLGTAALNGFGMTRDVQEAMRRLEQAALGGHLMAASILGRAYLTQYQAGWSTDLGRAVHWLSVGAAAGEPHGMYYLALIHADIAKDPPYRDPAKAVSLFRSCAALRHPPCVFAMGHVLQSGLGIARDFPAAYAHFSLALGLNEVKAKIRLEQLEKVMSPDELQKGKELAARMTQARPHVR